MSLLRPLLLVGVSLLLTATFAQDILVRPGDTLWDLARRHNTTIEALVEANGLTSSRLAVGSRLKLPGGPTETPTSYTVQRDDTLYDIALSFNINVDTLIAFNDLEGTSLEVGQVLSLVAPAEAAPEQLVVTVRAGDSLWLLAREHDVTISQLQAANNLTAASPLRPGQTLVIPGRYAPANAADIGGGAAPTVTVNRGDSLSAIARQHGTTVSALMAANGLGNTNIMVGQTLRIVPANDGAGAAPAQSPVPSASTAMVWPAQGAITSHFGYRRLRIGGTNNHTGLDLDGNTGDPIVAAIGGTVTFSGWQGGYGNLVIISNGNTLYYYAHASALLVSAGDRVETGQLIARIGSTGASTGPHLHFEIRVSGRAVDPLPVLQAQAGRR